jgi:hypothetical protein
MSTRSGFCDDGRGSEVTTGSLATTERMTGLTEVLRDDEGDEHPHAGGATAMQRTEGQLGRRGRGRWLPNVGKSDDGGDGLRLSARGRGRWR